MFKKLCVIASIFLAGCGTSEYYKAETRADGVQYIGSSEVVAAGELKDIVVFEKDGSSTKLSQAMSDLAGQGGVLNAASQAAGVSSIQGGAIGGVVGVFADLITGLNAPVVRAYVYDPKKEDTAEIPINPQFINQMFTHECVRIGDKVNVSKQAGRYVITPQNYKLIRTSSFEPSCEELRLQHE